MKKILLSVVAMGLMTVSALALDGTIGEVNFNAKGEVWVEVIPENGDPAQKKQLASAGDSLKAQSAAVLTAKSLNSKVTVWAGTLDGKSGWTGVVLK